MIKVKQSPSLKVWNNWVLIVHEIITSNIREIIARIRLFFLLLFWNNVFLNLLGSYLWKKKGSIYKRKNDFIFNLVKKGPFVFYVQSSLRACNHGHPPVAERNNRKWNASFHLLKRLATTDKATSWSSRRRHFDMATLTISWL